MFNNLKEHFFYIHVNLTLKMSKNSPGKSIDWLNSAENWVA